jgi:hypothetical protein
MTHRARAQVIAAILSIPLAALAVEAADESPRLVPDATIRRLQGEMIPPKSQMSDALKLRRYRSMLRGGARLEEEYANAANLHLVQNLMLSAARGIVHIEGTEQDRLRVVELSRRILASQAPPEGKLQADILLLQAKLAGLGGQADLDAITRQIEAFVGRYRESLVEPGGLLVAVQLARTYSVPDLPRTYVRELERFRDQPGVADFLHTQTGKSGFVREPFCGQLTRLDGTTLTLPRDLLGKVVLVHFWSAQTSALLGDMDWIAANYPQYKPFGLEVVSVNVDRSRRQLEDFLAEHTVPGIVTFSPLGLQQPVVNDHRIPRIPCSWLIGRDGRVLQDAKPGGRLGLRGAERRMAPTVLRTLCMDDRFPYYRSGEFLARWPGLAPEDAVGGEGIPRVPLEEIRAAVRVPPRQGIDPVEKAQRFRHVLELGEEIERQYSSAGELIPVRNWMMIAAKWLALANDDESMHAQAVAIAKRISPEATAPSSGKASARVLADYIVTQRDLRAESADRSRVNARIDWYVGGFAETEAAAPALILGTLLAMEYGCSDLREQYVERLGEQPVTQPGVRGFLRTVVQEEPDRGLPFVARLKRLDGGTLDMPKDLAGKVVVVHFWSVDHVPKPDTRWHDDGRSPNTNKGLAVVGINLDRERSRVEAFLAEHDLDWIHTFSGDGFDDSTARELDVRWLPSRWLIDREGHIIRGSEEGPILTRAALREWRGAVERSLSSEDH